MKRLVFLSGLLVSILIASNFMAVKLVDIGIITLPAAVICYPFCFMLSDLINDNFGPKTARLVIIFSFIFNAAVILFLSIAAFMPPSAFFANDEGFRAIFLSAPRILAASFVAFLAGGFLNAYVFDKFKRAGRHLAIRSSISTFLGVTVDSFIFIVGAFAFTSGMTFGAVMMMVLWQTLVKLLFGIGLGTPMTLLAAKFLPKLSEKDLKYFAVEKPQPEKPL